MRVREHGRLSGARVFEAAASLALCFALAGCSESPTTLRIVSGPPDANERVAALLESASAEVEA